jgi:hypothetical protein
MKYCTYKITFKDLPGYFYYGSHKDSGKPYYGSPVTWKRFWKHFEPQAQILQWYRTEKEVKEAEESIIRATWKDRYSLNENAGGRFSPEVCSANGKNFSPEVRSESGKKTGPRNIKAAQAAITLETRSDNGKKTAAANGKASSSKRVILTRIATGETFEFYSASEAARVLGLHQGHLSDLARGKLKQHKGYTARYF